MDEANNAAEGKETPKATKKTPNMRQLEASMIANQDATNERLDMLEQTLNDNAENVSSILEAIKGMSAQDRPTGSTPMVESNDLTMSHHVHREFDDNGNMVEIEPVSMSLEQLDQQKLEAMAFNAEPVMVRLNEGEDEQSDPRVEIAVNGKGYVMLRGETYTIPRYILEGLARARPYTFSNEEYTKVDGVKSVRWPAHIGLRYPFQVIRDDNPLGADWLQSIMSQRQ